MQNAAESKISSGRTAVIGIYCLLWYGSSSLTNNIAKNIFSLFQYPITLSWLQFLFVALYSFAYAYLFTFKALPLSTESRFSLPHHHNSSSSSSPPNNDLNEKNRMIFGAERIHLLTMNRSQIWQSIQTILPLAGFLICGHIFSSIAISRASVSFVHTIKALSPLFTVLVYSALAKNLFMYPFKVYGSLLPLTFGVMMSCSFDLSFNPVGLFCALMSTLIFVCQNIYNKSLFQRKALDKLSLLFFSSMTSFVMMTPVWYAWESDAFTKLFRSKDAGELIFWIFLNVTFHFCQNVVAFIILSMISPVSYSIASLFKRIFIIVSAILWIGQPVYFTQLVGIIMTFAGLYFYNSTRIIAPKHLELSKLSPSTTESKNAIEPRPSVPSQTITHQVLEKIRTFDIIREPSVDSLFDETMMSPREEQVPIDANFQEVVLMRPKN